LESPWPLVNLNRGGAASEAGTKQNTQDTVARFRIAIMLGDRTQRTRRQNAEAKQAGKGCAMTTPKAPSNCARGRRLE